MLAIDELKTEKWANQIDTLKQVYDSTWGSHFHYICSLVKMFGTTGSVLENIIKEWFFFFERIKEWSNYSQCRDANVAYKIITSFQLIVILYLMKEFMGLSMLFVNLCRKISRHIERYAISF
jgi:hypothetical protein